MLQNSPIILFAGPSLTGRSKQLIAEKEIALYPPVKRNDIAALLDSGFKGTLVIADGMFQQVLAVGHAEIRKALEHGCRVFGLSSMGAIRAFEMESLGMKGYGKVMDWFRSEDDFQDDEVALLHAPEPFFYSLSEPLIHFRQCLNVLTEQGRVEAGSARIVIDHLKSLYFGERTMVLFKSLLVIHTALDPDAVERDFDQYRIKLTDLEQFLEEEAWLIG